MSLLHEQFIADGSIASVLYSDVGDFYSRCIRLSPACGPESGWTQEASTITSWPVSWKSTDLADVETCTIRLDDLDRIADADAGLLKEVVKGGEQCTMSIVPTGPGLAWLPERAQIHAKAQTNKDSRRGRPDLGNTGWGVELGTPDQHGTWAFAVWTYDLAEQELQILRLRCPTVGQLGVIIGKAVEAAKQQGMERVTAWNLDRHLAEQTGGTITTRCEHLPAMAWYGCGDRLRWIANENWAWT